MFSDRLSGFPDRSEEPSSLCKPFSSISWERDVSPATKKHLLCYQVSLIDHRLVWVLVGLVWRILHVELLEKTVERVYRLAVVQLQSPIHHSLGSNRDGDVLRSLVVVEETCMISHTRLLQFSISQLLEYNKLEVFLGG